MIGEQSKSQSRGNKFFTNAACANIRFVFA